MGFSLMPLLSFISPNAVISKLRVTTKKQALQELAARASRLTRLSERAIFETLLERERLGTTGIGQGIAIPHAKLAGLEQLTAVFARLAEPVDFESIDDQPVDLVFLLLAPEGAGADHLKALAQISRLMRNAEMVERLRGCEDPAALYALLTEPMASTPHAA
jgi:PTS system nitrogen regulatory IIA component